MTYEEAAATIIKHQENRRNKERIEMSMSCRDFQGTKQSASGLGAMRLPARKKTILASLTVMAVGFSTVFAFAETDSSVTSFDLNRAGVSFVLPESLQELEGTIQPAYGGEIEQGSGIYLSGLTYCAMTKEKYMELATKGAELTEEDISFASPRMRDFILVYTIDEERSEEELLEALSAYGLPSEGCQELGTAGEYSFFSVVDPFANVDESQFVFDEGFREEYDRILAACEDLSWIKMYEPEGDGTAKAGSRIAFETADLDGNAVLSEDIFSRNKLTMVNIWGTYCGPCINEMPDLEELNRRLTEKGCGIIGIVSDIAGAADTAQIEAARQIITDAGVSYLNLLPWDGLRTDLPAMYIPTSYFINSDGEVVGEAAVGARGADDYEALIDALLE